MIYGTVHFNIKDILHHVYTIGFTMSGHESLLGGFWFLKYLFFASVVMLYIRQKVSNEFVSLGGVIILTQIFASCGLRIPYWGLNFTLFMSLSFMIAGFIYHQYDEWLQKHTTLLTFGCLVIVVLGSLFWPGSMLTISSLYCVPYIISGIAGSIMVLEICRFLANKISPRCYAIWKYVGDNTLIVLCLHMLCFKLVSLVIVVIYHLSAYRIAEFITIHDFSIKGWWLLYVLVGTLMPLGIQLLYKHAHSLITRKWNLYKLNKYNS